MSTVNCFFIAIVFGLGAVWLLINLSFGQLFMLALVLWFATVKIVKWLERPITPPSLIKQDISPDQLKSFMGI